MIVADRETRSAYVCVRTLNQTKLPSSLIWKVRMCHPPNAEVFFSSRRPSRTMPTRNTVGGVLSSSLVEVGDEELSVRSEGENEKVAKIEMFDDAAHLNGK